MQARLSHIVLLLFTALFVLSCQPGADQVNDRLAYAAKNTGDIVVGINWPFSKLHDHFREGLILARDEINARGGVLGRKIKLDMRDNKAKLSDARRIANSFASNEKMTAVIGHTYSSIAIQTSIIYESAGLLFITPRAQLASLSEHGLNLFFRTLPSNEFLGEKAAEYTYRMNFRKPVIIMQNEDFSKNLANIYQTNLAPDGINIVYTFYYFPWNQDIRGIVNQLQHLDFDVIFLVVDDPFVPQFIKAARTLGVTQPFMVMNMSLKEIRQQAGRLADSTLNIGFFNPNDPSPKTVAFVDAYKKQFGAVPDIWAAKGYDALNLLADEIEQAQSTNPYEIAANMHYLVDWPGVTGKHTFNLKGDVTISPFFLESIEKGEIRYHKLDEFPQPDLFQKLSRVFRVQVKNKQIELVQKNGVISIRITDDLLFGHSMADLTFDGRNALDEIASAFESLDSTSLHVIGRHFYEPVVVGMGIGDMEESELSSIRSMIVGSFLIDQGVDSKQIFVSGNGASGSGTGSADMLPKELVPEGVKVVGDRVEILFVPDSVFTPAKKRSSVRLN